MKLLLTAILLILVVSDLAWSRTYWVDNKSVCENSRGTWREYGNSCANNCQSQVQNNVCTMGLLYTCDCGANRCWDGDKCANFKLYKAAFDEEERERLEDEAEDRAEALAALPPPIASATAPANAQSSSTKTLPVTPKTAVSTILATDQKPICLQKGGNWKAFINSCVNSCDNKIITNPVCSSNITFGCDCGDNKCWDAKANQCSSIDDYRRLNSSTPSQVTLPVSSLPTAPDATSTPTSAPNFPTPQGLRIRNKNDQLLQNNQQSGSMPTSIPVPSLPDPTRFNFATFPANNK